MSESPDTSHRWTLDRTISANTVMSLIVGAAAIFGAYYGVRSDIAVVDGKIEALKLRVDYEQGGDRRAFDAILGSLRRIEDKLDGKADKPGR